MTILDKFYSDAHRIVEKLHDSVWQQELCGFFVQTIHNYDSTLLSLADSAVEYWHSSHYNDTADEAVQWFYRVFALFSDNFTNDIDFSDEDWKELSAIVCQEADTLDMDTVSAIMRIMVDRRKFD